MDREEISVDNEQTYLDVSLEKMYKNYVEFQIKEDEVDFIRERIERLVWSIALLVRKYAQEGIMRLIELNLVRNPHLRIVYNKNLRDSELLVKAGSFYEKTKTAFPDEFDFVFIVCTFICTSKRIYRHTIKHKIEISELNDVVKKVLSIENVQKLISNICQMQTEGTRGLFMPDFKRFVQYTGPSAKLHFVYLRNVEEPSSAVNISVDFVPAFKIVDPYLKNKARKICKIPAFCNEVARTGSILYVKGELSLTETEVSFMKNTLSSKHRYVYKLLKVLIHGNSELTQHFTNEFYPLSKLIDSDFDVPSYEIKVAVIYHHYSCRDKQSSSPSQCLVEILQYLHTGYSTYKYWYNWYTTRITTKKLIKYPVDVLTKEYFVAKRQTKTVVAEALWCLIDTLQWMQQTDRNISEQTIEPYPLRLWIGKRLLKVVYPFWPQNRPYFLSEECIRGLENWSPNPLKTETTNDKRSTVSEGKELQVLTEDVAAFYHRYNLTSNMLKEFCALWRFDVDEGFGKELLECLEALQQHSLTIEADETGAGMSRAKVDHRNSLQEESDEMKSKEKSVGVQSIDLVLLREVEYTGKCLSFDRFFQVMTVALCFHEKYYWRNKGSGFHARMFDAVVGSHRNESRGEHKEIRV